MTTIYRYIQLGIHVRARYDKETGKFMREVCEVTEFFVNDENKPESNTIYRKNVDGTEILNGPSNHLIDYLMSQGVDLTKEKTLDNVMSNGSNIQVQNNNTVNQSNNAINTNNVTSNNNMDDEIL